MVVSWTSSLCVFLLLAPEPIEMRFVQVVPAAHDDSIRRSPDQGRAIVLIHGLRPHPFNNTLVALPDLSGWEKPGSTLVKTLAPLGDVFALGYGQTQPIDQVARAPALYWSIERLRRSGYGEIVLIGHSAGGLVARYFVEDTGGEGVTKVIQVSSPNDGTGWGKRTVAVRQPQELLLVSLSREARATSQRARGDRTIPAGVEFACMVGSTGLGGDGVVRIDSQWPADLRRQGIPAIFVHTTHMTVMRSKAVAERLAELVRGPLPRWTPMEVEAARQKYLGKEKSAAIMRSDPTSAARP